MSYRDNDTIAAISTPPGRGAIGIVRLSGPDAFEIGLKIFRSKTLPSPFEPEKIQKSPILGSIFDPDDEKSIDQALALFFPADSSFTGENLLELHGHGNPMILNEILNLSAKFGARMAEPGEFCQRALLNGKMDLTQLESIEALVNSSNIKVAKYAAKTLAGELGRKIETTRKQLVDVLARIEVILDYPEEDIEDYSLDEIKKALIPVVDKINFYIEEEKKVRYHTNELNICIIGKPNTGKSTLMNYLIGKERVIVAPTPGTTRDLITESIFVHGHNVRIMDTAGIRESQNEIEQIGIEKTKEAIAEADVIIHLMSIDTMESQEKDIISDMIANKPEITILNKIDLDKSLTLKDFSEDVQEEPLLVSLLNKTNVHAVDHAIKRSIQAGHTDKEAEMYVNRRQATLLAESLEQLIAVQAAEGLPLDLLAINLHAALQALDEITGKNATEEILDTIFSQFCVGK